VLGGACVHAGGPHILAMIKEWCLAGEQHERQHKTNEAAASASTSADTSRTKTLSEVRTRVLMPDSAVQSPNMRKKGQRRGDHSERAMSAWSRTAIAPSGANNNA
jgi:hypothetical protein